MGDADFVVGLVEIGPRLDRFLKFDDAAGPVADGNSLRALL